MNSHAVYHLLAELVVILHATYVGFVIAGFALIVVGSMLDWVWIRNFWFRLAHLAAIGLVFVEAVGGVVCPLTTLENSLRMSAGQYRYAGDFLGYWAHELIFYNGPPWVLTLGYLSFGALVAIAFILAPPRLPHRART
jgi:hypothetical protein